MVVEALFLPCNEHTKWVLEKIEAQIRKNRGVMTADMHRIYVSAACYYTGMGVKRALGTVTKAKRNEECGKSYKETVAPGFLRYLVDTMEHAPPIALTVDMMASTTLKGVYRTVQQYSSIVRISTSLSRWIKCTRADKCGAALAGWPGVSVSARIRARITR